MHLKNVKSFPFHQKWPEDYTHEINSRAYKNQPFTVFERWLSDARNKENTKQTRISAYFQLGANHHYEKPLKMNFVVGFFFSIAIQRLIFSGVLSSPIILVVSLKTTEKAIKIMNHGNHQNPFKITKIEFSVVNYHGQCAPGFSAAFFSFFLPQ